VNALEEAFSLAQDEISELEKKNSDLERVNIEVRKQLEALQTSLDDSLAQIAQKNDQLEQLTQSKDKELEKLTESKDELKNLVDSKDRELQDLTKSRDKELENMEDALNLVKMENTQLEEANASLEARNKELNELLSAARNDASRMEGELATRSEEMEGKLVSLQQQAEEKNLSMLNELNCVKEQLQNTASNSDGLAKAMGEKEENEQALCTEIKQLQNDNSNLNETIAALEATILQLDGDMNASKGNLDSSKLREDELQESLVTVNKENEEIKNQMKEIDEILKSYAERTDSRRNSEEASVDQQSVTAFPTACNLSEVLSALEEARLELADSLRNAVLEKEEFVEKNKSLQQSLLREKEKFDGVLTKSLQLQQQLQLKGESNHQLTSKVEKEIQSLQELLTCTEEQYNTLTGNEQQMEGNIDLLAQDLANKEKEIVKLQQHISKMDNMVKESNALTLHHINNAQQLQEQRHQLLQGKDDDLSHLQNKLLNLQDEKLQLIKEKEALKQTYLTETDVLINKLNDSDAQNEMLLKDIALKDETLKTNAVEITSLNEKILVNETKISNLNVEQEKGMAMLDKFTERINQAEMEYVEILRECEETKLELKYCLALLQRAGDAVSNKQGTIETVVSMAQKEMSMHKSTVELVKSMYDEVTHVNPVHIQELRELGTLLASVQNNNLSLKEGFEVFKKSVHTNTVASISSMQQREVLLHKNITRLDTQVSTQCANMEELNRKLEDSSRQVSDQTSELERVTKELAQKQLVIEEKEQFCTQKEREYEESVAKAEQLSLALEMKEKNLSPETNHLKRNGDAKLFFFFYY
jgi:chromosome segregation ATPase